ncbi:MAG: hypothetical protein ACE10C_10695 [Candidatus Binatia bacterium]
MITEKEFTKDDVVLITGVSGRIGRNLVNQLGKNCTIVGFDLQKNNPFPPTSTLSNAT